MIKNILLKNFDLLLFLRNHNYDYKFVGSKTQYLLSTCPFCGKEYHLGFCPESHWFGCYKCNEKGDSVHLIKKILGTTFLETLEYLKEGMEEGGANISVIENALGIIKPYSNLKDKVKPIAFPEGYIPLRDKRIPYLDQRGITQDQVQYYKMGVCLHGRYQNRLIVCDVNENQEPIYWIARDMTGKVPKSQKVYNPPSLNENIGSGDILFNFFLAKNYEVGIITEGVFDSLWIGNNGLATYGAGLKKHHMYWLLLGNFKEFILLYDPDVSDEKLEKNAVLLATFFNTRICKLTKGDPDEHSKEELTQLISNAPLFKPSRLDHISCEIS